VPQQEELQCGGSKSVNARGASRWWQKWEFEGKLPSPPPYFLHFFGCKEDDNNAIIVFFCVFLL
jgi:hypothetical protein